ncbi:exodeoxyribonuclease V subunit beta [Thermomonas carbonis]|uniref:RecBCD enzyme subunit RecB n=1 Tax=Thermomonas carbonis TaxID=1463158 RepID=A0A7G9ST41_9GAMM|nr:exodeoxyribonuclease V subunit beta [Thermomonas carbonis]QNN71016.1 exodeoxyribonuclease V subunit beta [Thermomonas carbonis]GHC03949.1 RecBCD enzyme subunit RecB [Thermomonas carbonis]
MSDIARDPYLDLPLDGLQLIEASAGTGKTFTLATLVTRLVVERGLRIGQILAVTFTEAATQELRKRIRERLQLTLDLLDAPAADDDSAEASLTRQLLDAHRTRSEESDESLRRRLRQATLETDLAAIFTIHGFCARVLREHAVESGQGFDAATLLTNDRDLRAELAADLWRVHAQDSAGADDLAMLWSGGFEDLAKDLPALLREPVLFPPLADAGLAASIDALQRDVLHAQVALQQAWNEYGEDFLDALAAAIDADVMHRGQYKQTWLANLRQWLQGFACDPWLAGAPHPKLEKLTATALAAGTKKGNADRTPVSAHVSNAVAYYLDALLALDGLLARRRGNLLHRIRDDARARLALLKQQRRVQTYDDLIDGVADALAQDDAGTLVRQLRTQYAVALVDEFQDTDARQWAIFNRVFGSDNDAPALFLIGDPKQAIYGFRGGDVHTYLAAANIAEPAPPLSHNFRSRPALLRAVAAMYDNAGDAAFIDPRIGFFAVEAGGKRRDDGFLRNGEPAPALTVWCAPKPPVDDKGKQKPWSASESRELATHACVAAIHAVLSEARAGKALIDGEPVQPGDIAVLVRSHREATMIQQALALVGIAAVAAGKQSLFATAEARDLHALLLALLHGGDDGRLRTALSTVLVGVDALGIDNLEADADAHRVWQQRAMGWRERLLRGGPLALIGDLCATHAERLLGLLDGERRMSNYLQLAELLQEAQAGALGLHGLVDWLGQRIATADSNDETQLLRLESDARRVQIVTLHKSKGLEYPLVFLPFVGIGGKPPSPGRCCVAHDAASGQRRLHWGLELPEAEWNTASEAWKHEQLAEDARLLYVGLTRAEHALWIASGNFFNAVKTPLAKMLGDVDALTNAGIVFDASRSPDQLARLPAESDATIPPARSVTRRLSHDWWVYSFSQLAKADAGIETASASTLPASGGNDEPDASEDAPVDTDFDARFAGNRYGVALHAALEHADFAAWRDWRAGDVAPNDEADVIVDALGKEGYGADVLEDGVALTTQFVGQTLTVALPEGVRLCDVPAFDRRAEIEFQFSLRTTQVDALLQLLHAHGVVRERNGFGLRQRLEGLMTGLIDLTYRHAGKWYVLDYKSNRLPAYDAPNLQRAMAHSEYDLQALIYTLALHRWLRFRLRDGYDYARDFGGIRYVFCRGLDADRDDSPGIHAQRFTPELVDALDALFGGGDAIGAAA